MKHKNNYLVVGLLLIVFGLVGLNNLFAADTYNTTASMKEATVGGRWADYYGTITTTDTDSTDTHYTQALWIGDCNDVDAYFYAVMSNDAGGTEDCNVFVEYSFDKTTWFVGEANSGKIKDQLTTTAISDTLNVVTGTRDHYFNIAPWMRLKCDMQAGNPSGTVLTWRIALKKSATLLRKVLAVSNKN